MESPPIQKLKQQFTGKKVLIVGLGLQGGGVGLVKFFSGLGAEVTATDLKSEKELTQSVEALRSHRVNYSLDGHKMADFVSADYIFKGPSVFWDLPELIAAEQKQIPIEMEASFFSSLCPALIIGVTGTRGKTTTASMIHETLKHAAGSVYLAGNVAGSSTIDLLYKVKKGDLVILELSSWQLSGFHRKKLSPHIAVFTNFYSDHLNYYKTEDKYFFDKSAIYAYQSKNDYLIANTQLISKLKDQSIKSTVSYFSAEDFPQTLTNLRGIHNLENAAAALAVNKILNNDLVRATKIISNFKSILFRQEIIAEKDDIFFINDSTSTTPTSTIKALEAFNDGKVVLILGGNSKQLPFNDLLNKLEAVNDIVLLKGSFTDEILSALKERFPDKISGPYDNLKSAVQKAYELAQTFKKRAYVLFSPGATSFSMFSNEFDRGKQFNQIVDSL